MCSAFLLEEACLFIKDNPFVVAKQPVLELLAAKVRALKLLGL